MKNKLACPPLYKQYYLDKADERRDLFRKLVKKYGIQSALYPGGFVHFTPSFMIPRTVYVDSYAKAKNVFNDPNMLAYIFSRKEYDEEPEVIFHSSDYNRGFDEKLETFDLLISQYAPFVSLPCKKYLKVGGILVANNSHGDASMAHLDPDFEFIAVANRRGEQFSIIDKGLERYFIPKREVDITAEYLKEIGRGVAYTKGASNYIFRRVH